MQDKNEDPDADDGEMEESRRPMTLGQNAMMFLAAAGLTPPQETILSEACREAGMSEDQVREVLGPELVGLLDAIPHQRGLRDIIDAEELRRVSRELATLQTEDHWAPGLEWGSVPHQPRQPYRSPRTSRLGSDDYERVAKAREKRARRAAKRQAQT